MSAANNWPRVRLGDVCEVHIGKTPPRGVPDYWCCADGDGMVWLSIADLLNTVEGVVAASKERITHTALDSCGVPIVKKGTFLLSFKLTLGRCAVAGCDLCTNEAIAALPFKNEYADKVDLVYLRRYCEYFDWNAFAEKDEKVLGKTLNKKKIAEVPLLLPPLPVQREIVARLEKVLGQVDQLAKKFADLETAAEAEFKATLKETFDALGNGTNGTDGTNGTRRSVADVSVADVADVSAVPSTATRWVRLGEVSTIGYGYTAKALPACNTKPRYLRITDIQNDAVSWNDVPCCECEELDEYELHSGDIVFARTGATTGKSYLLQGEFPLSVFASYLIRVVINDKDVLRADYLKYYFDTPEYWNAIQCGMAGAAQGGFNSKKLAALEIPLPPLSAQRAIVARLDAAKARKEKLMAAAKRGAAEAALWRKAILKEAFE